MTARVTTQSRVTSQIVRLHARKFLVISLFLSSNEVYARQNDVHVLYVRCRKK